MKTLVAALILTTALPAVVSAPASGLVGIYGIVQRVELEPNAAAPRRIRIWGAFAFVDGGAQYPVNLEITAAKRGQLYFSLPAADVQIVQREWADIRSVAGTGNAIGFGKWSYGGQFSPEVKAPGGFAAVGRMPDGPAINTWIEPDSARAPTPKMYLPNVGVVKLTEAAHASVIQQLRAALR